MCAFFIATVLTFGLLGVCHPGSNLHHVLHERRDETEGWAKVAVVPHDTVLPMRIALTQSNLHRGHDLLMEVSDPTSARYGQYYSSEDINDLFAPSGESVAAVRSWLAAAGINSKRISQSYNNQWLQFDAHTTEAESLLRTKFHVYEHAHTGRLSVGCDEYHVPTDAQPHIDYITPGIKVLEPRRIETIQKRITPVNTTYYHTTTSLEAFHQMALAESKGDLKICNTFTTPKCLRALYDIPIPTSAQPGNKLGLFESVGWVDSVDMNLFYQSVDTRIPNGTYPPFKGIDGAKNKNNPKAGGEEAGLDYSVAISLIYPQNSVVFEPEDYSYTDFLDAIDGSFCDNSNVESRSASHQCGVYKPTNVISFSYGLPEIGSYAGSRKAQQRTCNEFLKLGMQGVSLVFSSGDAGVSNCGTPHNVFTTEFPANCPYVTSVGATGIPPGVVAGKGKESASTEFPSGGGFSTVFERPSYQDSAINTFFNSPQAPTYPYYNSSKIGDGVYNRSGRGTPDVSANGENFPYFSGGLPTLGGGTSQSAPIFASILTLINEERLAAGKPTVGFVNPILYQNPQAFNDITTGNNVDCHKMGFNATTGWDPVTGLGTPNYPALLDVFMKAA